MKLAEALILRADFQVRVGQLRDALRLNAIVQEGELPAQDPQELLAQFEDVMAQLLRLIRAINHTNVATPFEDGGMLTDALAARDVLKGRLATYKTLIDAATVRHDRYSRSEIKFQSTVNIAALQKLADDLARRVREVDTKIQGLNWTTDLIEN